MGNTFVHKKFKEWLEERRQNAANKRYTEYLENIDHIRVSRGKKAKYVRPVSRGSVGS